MLYMTIISNGKMRRASVRLAQRHEDAWQAAIAMKDAVLPMESAPMDWKPFIGLVKEDNKTIQVICWNGGGDWLCNTTQGEDLYFPIGWQKLPDIHEHS